MRTITKLLLFATIFLSMNACGNKQEKTACEAQQTTEFRLGTGVNVSHWLSQSELRGAEREQLITKKDFDSIAAMGFEHVRLPIDEVQLYDEAMNRHEDAFRLMHNAIEWTLENGMNIIVDLHIIRSHHFNSENGENTLFEKAEEQEKMIRIWLDLQKDLAKYPTDRVAYELMNEAVAPTDEDWNKLIAKLISSIREQEPERKIVVGSNLWQTVETFANLRVPEDDKNLILSFHFYYPLVVTHYRAWWTGLKDFTGVVNYPGQAIDTALYATLPPALVAEIRKSNGVWNKERLAATMKPAIDKAKEFNLPLYCGEFGAYPAYLDKEVRLRWYRDIAAIFRENNINNAHWCYKGDFPVVNADGSRNELPAILLGKEKRLEI
nr:glycoside hydrolase [uncultured bacterium]